MPSASEKTPAEADEKMVPSTPKSGTSDVGSDTYIDPVAEKKLIRKLDLVIYPTFFVIYMMSFLDRINISNARIQGMVEDLELTGNRFNIALFVSLLLAVAFPSACTYDANRTLYLSGLLYLLYPPRGTVQHDHQPSSPFALSLRSNVHLGNRQHVHGIRQLLRRPRCPTLPPRHL